MTGSTGIGGAVASALGERALTVGRSGMIRADPSLLSETARVADEVAARGTRLSAIVCCAGVLAPRAAHTAEGLERAFVLNHLSRYLLVRRLLPLLEPGGRVCWSRTPAATATRWAPWTTSTCAAAGGACASPGGRSSPTTCSPSSSPRVPDRVRLGRRAELWAAGEALVRPWPASPRHVRP
ncbi:hypothetical protein [Actinoplanes sp. URMC 104]|uniref:hypothetical protein n=1 Tax=Actinoplanes sp. URMC 104 TaxID=3423409 RepID=UPI003F1C1CEC